MTYQEIKDKSSLEVENSPKKSNSCMSCVLCFGVMFFIIAIVIGGLVTGLVVFQNENSGVITVVNDYNVEVLVGWIRHEVLAKQAILIPGQADGYRTGPWSAYVGKISTQLYKNDPWNGPLYHMVNGFGSSTYNVSQLRGPQRNITKIANVTNDLDFDVWATWQSGNVTLHETRIEPGHSDIYAFDNQPSPQISTLVCDQNRGRWATPRCYFLSDNADSPSYNVSQIRQMGTQSCSFERRTPC
jgi:hypothetical protein